MSLAEAGTELISPTKYTMFFPSHPAMVQVMSFDIKIHQVSIDSKYEQFFDFIASDRVHYHLKCRKYSDNWGDNENILCFSHCIQLLFKSCPLTSNFIKFHLMASTSSVLTSLRRTNFIITCIVINILIKRVILNIYCGFQIASSYGSKHVL